MVDQEDQHKDQLSQDIEIGASSVDEWRKRFVEQLGLEHCPELQRWKEKCSGLLQMFRWCCLPSVLKTPIKLYAKETPISVRWEEKCLRICREICELLAASS